MSLNKIQAYTLAIKRIRAEQALHDIRVCSYPHLKEEGKRSLRKDFEIDAGQDAMREIITSEQLAGELGMG